MAGVYNIDVRVEHMEKEYKGQKILAEYDARLIPPDDHYSDCECVLVLTKQHLYVLEDNFDGTYEMHFEFVLDEIDDIVIEQQQSKKYTNSQAASGAGELITGIACVLGGVAASPGLGNRRAAKKEYLAIVYHEVLGEIRKLYFEAKYSGAKNFVKKFHKERAR